MNNEVDVQASEPSQEELTQAVEIIKQDRAKREQRCKEEIQAILDKYGCDLIASFVVKAR